MGLKWRKVFAFLPTGFGKSLVQFRSVGESTVTALAPIGSLMLFGLIGPL